MNQNITIQFVEPFHATSGSREAYFQKGDKKKALVQDKEIWIKIGKVAAVVVPPSLVKILKIHQPKNSKLT